MSFRYEIHKDGTTQFGLIAEEVAQVYRDLVIYEADGKPYTVRYDAMNAMLLNEFPKEHRKVHELKDNALKQGMTIDRQQKQIDALTAGLQKVSAQLELGKMTPQEIVKNQ